MALKRALLIAATIGGGTIKFKCGVRPVTITLTATLLVPGNTTIDGGGLVTLTSTVGPPLLVVSSRTSVALRSLSILTPTVSCCVNVVDYDVLNEGTLSVNSSAFAGNPAAFFCCGAILNRGTLVINNSTFSGHRTHDDGGAIFNEGTLTIKNSEFDNNVVADDGGAILNLGTLAITNSAFTGNGTGNGSAAPSTTAAGPRLRRVPSPPMLRTPAAGSSTSARSPSVGVCSPMTPLFSSAVPS